MKRFLKIILGALLLLAGVVLFARILFNKPVPKGLSADEQVQVILEGSECLVCHSKDAKMPFYSNFPVIGKMMEGHVRAGNRFLDLGKELADIDNISEAALSKLEHSALYGNMPLIEPLETRETHKIRDFVIVIDTSYSVSGEPVEKFLKETFSILTETNSFFVHNKIRIIQCDDSVDVVSKWNPCRKNPHQAEKSCKSKEMSQEFHS